MLYLVSLGVTLACVLIHILLFQFIIPKDLEKLAPQKRIKTQSRRYISLGIISFLINLPLSAICLAHLVVMGILKKDDLMNALIVTTYCFSFCMGFVSTFQPRFFSTMSLEKIKLASIAFGSCLSALLLVLLFLYILEDISERKFDSFATYARYCAGMTAIFATLAFGVKKTVRKGFLATGIPVPEELQAEITKTCTETDMTIKDLIVLNTEILRDSYEILLVGNFKNRDLILVISPLFLESHSYGEIAELVKPLVEKKKKSQFAISPASVKWSEKTPTPTLPTNTKVA